jgi:D-alanyl-D-alanine carboxypeptidase
MRRARLQTAAATAGIAALALCAAGSSPSPANQIPWSASVGGGAYLTAPAGVSAPKPTLQRVVRSLVAARAPGAVAFVRTPTRARSAAAGVASFEPRVAMRAADRYRIASVTKTFVATVVLQLVAEGKLRLADPVERWLPRVVPNGAAITIRQLLNHTSGLFEYTRDEQAVAAVVANPGRSWTPRELLAVAFSHPPLFAPGSDWAYSNTNYVVLGLVVEAVTGKPVEQVLAERLFEPLGLRATSFPSGLPVPEPFAHGYGVFQGTLLDLTPLLNPSWAYASGQMVSNAADVTTFFAALLRGRLLPAALLSQMKSFTLTSGTYGLGLQSFFTRCGTAFGHGGDFIGWQNIVLASANGRRVAVVMVNIDATRVSGPRLIAAAISALCSG